MGAVRFRYLTEEHLSDLTKRNWKVVFIIKIKTNTVPRIDIFNKSAFVYIHSDTIAKFTKTIAFARSFIF